MRWVAGYVRNTAYEVGLPFSFERTFRLAPTYRWGGRTHQLNVESPSVCFLYYVEAFLYLGPGACLK